MDRSQITRYAVILFLGFIFGGYLGFNTGKTFTKPIEVPIEAPTPTQNKLFEFFNTFTPFTENTGTPKVEIINPDQQLMLISYFTSQETSEFGVYDYKNNNLYIHIGHSGLGGGSTPIAFIGADKLLMYTDVEDLKPTLSVVDFNGNEIKVLLTDVVLQGATPYGKEIYIYTEVGPKKTKTYILNTATLELTEQGQPKG